MSVQVTLVYARFDRQLVFELSLPAGACVEDALAAVAAEPGLRGVALAEAAIGIWGDVVNRRTVLTTGDRVEVYRPLQRDPREVRRLRAQGKLDADPS